MMAASTTKMGGEQWQRCDPTRGQEVDDNDKHWGTTCGARMVAAGE